MGLGAECVRVCVCVLPTVRSDRAVTLTLASLIWRAEHWSALIYALTLSVGPHQSCNYSRAICHTSWVEGEWVVGRALREFPPCSMDWEHVKLSARKSRWSNNSSPCGLDMLFYLQLWNPPHPPPFCACVISPTSNLLPATFRCIWPFLSSYLFSQTAVEELSSYSTLLLSRSANRKWGQPHKKAAFVPLVLMSLQQCA